MQYVPLVEFVLKFTTPNGLPPSSVPQRVACLDHEALDDSVEEEAIIVTILAMGGEILDSSWALFRIELQLDVTHGGVEDL